MKVGFDVIANKNLYREYKRRINARDVLDHYNAENCQELINPDGTTEIVHSCLLDRVEPHHANGDRNPSASINLEKKVYVCYNYWGGDLFHLIMKMEQKEKLSDIFNIAGEFLDNATVSGEDFKDEIEKILAGNKSYEIDLPEYSMKVLAPWAFSHPYIRERGITLEASSMLQVGYDPTTNRIVFPHFWNGKLVGWQQRSIPADPRWPASDPAIPKYKNSSGFPKSETLYGAQWLKDSDTVIVVESPMSVAKAHSLGLTNVLATFGAKVSSLQIDLLKGFSRVVLWFDADHAGRLAEKKVTKGLFGFTDVKVVAAEENKDLADYQTIEEVVAMIDSAVPSALVLAQWDREKLNVTKKSKKRESSGRDSFFR